MLLLPRLVKTKVLQISWVFVILNSFKLYIIVCSKYLNMNGLPNPEIAKPEPQQVSSSGFICSNLLRNMVSSCTKSPGNSDDTSLKAYKIFNRSVVESLSLIRSVRSASSYLKNVVVPACT